MEPRGPTRRRPPPAPSRPDNGFVCAQEPRPARATIHLGLVTLAADSVGGQESRHRRVPECNKQEPLLSFLDGEEGYE